MALAGGFLENVKQAYSSPESFIEATLSEPSISGVGGLGAVVTKNISKTVTQGGIRGLAAGAVGGFLLANLLGGGQEQTQQQQAQIEPEQTTSQTQDILGKFRQQQALVGIMRTKAEQRIKRLPGKRV